MSGVLAFPVSCLCNAAQVDKLHVVLNALEKEPYLKYQAPISHYNNLLNPSLVRCALLGAVKTEFTITVSPLSFLGFSLHI